MKLALYKGPAPTWQRQLNHRITALVTGSIYSHCEIVIGNTCYSSSSADGGVRSKVVDFTTGRWDLFEVAGDETAALAWFLAHRGQGYDWAGLARFVLPFLAQHDEQWFCSEACAAMLGISYPGEYSPEKLLTHLIDLGRVYSRESKTSAL